MYFYLSFNKLNHKLHRFIDQELLNYFIIIIYPNINSEIVNIHLKILIVKTRLNIYFGRDPVTHLINSNQHVRACCRCTVIPLRTIYSYKMT